MSCTGGTCSAHPAGERMPQPDASRQPFRALALAD